MKYIITDKGEVRKGYGYHVDLAKDCVGKVVSAGHFEVRDGEAIVFGESVGYGITAKDSDAALIQKSLTSQELFHA